MCNHMAVRNCFFCHALAKTSLQGKFTLSLKTDEEETYVPEKKKQQHRKRVQNDKHYRTLTVLGWVTI